MHEKGDTVDTKEKELSDLRPGKPVKFPSKHGKYVVYRIEGSKGKSTKLVIQEIKKLSEKDVFDSPDLDHAKGT